MRSACVQQQAISLRYHAAFRPNNRIAIISNTLTKSIPHFPYDTDAGSRVYDDIKQGVHMSCWHPTQKIIRIR